MLLLLFSSMLERDLVLEVGIFGSTWRPVLVTKPGFRACEAVLEPGVDGDEVVVGVERGDVEICRIFFGIGIGFEE
jgi:hypothetical protein